MDRYRVEIEQVVKDDTEMDQRLEAVIGAVSEAMNNSAWHSGSKAIDVFADIRDQMLHLSVGDRRQGFDTSRPHNGISHSLVEPVEGAGGYAELKSKPGRGTEVLIALPLE